MADGSRYGAPHENNGDDDAMTHLEALLLSADDEGVQDLDLALGIIQELDTSLLETETFAPIGTSCDSPELLMLHSLYQDEDSSLLSYTELLTANHLALHPASTGLISPSSAKRNDKKCTYQNRREEIQTLRDEVVTLEAQMRKLQQSKLWQRQMAGEERNRQQSSATFAAAESENAQLKAAILAQKAQLNNLLEAMQANNLIVTKRPVFNNSESELLEKC